MTEANIQDIFQLHQKVIDSYTQAFTTFIKLT